MDIKGKAAIVTGAAAGIGRASAVQLARRGLDRLLLVDVDEAGLAETARLTEGVATECHRLDLADLDATARWFAAHGDVDILHNNAGVVSGEPAFPKADVARLRWIVDINLTSLVTATQVTAQLMHARGGGG